MKLAVKVQMILLDLDFCMEKFVEVWNAYFVVSACSFPRLCIENSGYRLTGRMSLESVGKQGNKELLQQGH